MPIIFYWEMGIDCKKWWIEAVLVKRFAFSNRRRKPMTSGTGENTELRPACLVLYTPRGHLKEPRFPKMHVLYYA